MTRSNVIRSLVSVAGVLFALAAAVPQAAEAATLTVRNNCGYTIYPGIYPPVFQNGGWSQGPGVSVSFAINSGWIGRVWGRTGCNGSSPAQCATGSCGGSGLQCAGTTGFPNTSLFEANINASGTDWYNISYVDAVDNPLGLQVTNGSCLSPNTCSNSVLTSCPAGLRSGSACLSPCTRYNTDQFCCRGAFGLPSTCIVANWSGEAQTYVNNIHNFCPRQYSYAYDEVSGGALHTCPTGANYTLTFCPSGGGSATPTPAPRATATPTARARGTATATSRARATATARARATATPTTPSNGGCAAAWNCTTVYQVGNIASYNGVNYRLNWGPRGGQCPGFNPSLDNWWISQGACN